MLTQPHLDTLKVASRASVPAISKATFCVSYAAEIRSEASFHRRTSWDAGVKDRESSETRLMYQYSKMILVLHEPAGGGDACRVWGVFIKSTVAVISWTTIKDFGDCKMRS